MLGTALVGLNQSNERRRAVHQSPSHALEHPDIGSAPSRSQPAQDNSCYSSCRPSARRRADRPVIGRNMTLFDRVVRWLRGQGCLAATGRADRSERSPDLDPLEELTRILGGPHCDGSFFQLSGPTLRRPQTPRPPLARFSGHQTRGLASMSCQFNIGCRSRPVANAWPFAVKFVGHELRLSADMQLLTAAHS
jgi:hypothetical protein